MAVLIKEYCLERAHAIGTFFERLAASDMSIQSPVSVIAWQRFVDAEVNRAGRDFRVAIDEEGAIVGLLTSSLRRERLSSTRHLRILVLPSMRRKGIGMSLFRETSGMESDECADLQTVCHSTWSAAIEFYSRLGFEEVDRELTLQCDPFNKPSIQPALFSIYKADQPLAHAIEVSDLHNKCFSGDLAFVRSTPEAMRTQLAMCSGLWLAKRGEAIIGFCQVESDGDLGWIESVAVDASQRRLGVGYALCSAAVREFDLSGRKTRLNVSGSNVGAVSLYRQIGFVEHSTAIRLRLASTNDDRVKPHAGRSSRPM